MKTNDTSIPIEDALRFVYHSCLYALLHDRIVVLHFISDESVYEDC